MKRATITLTFNVPDPATLTKLADEAIEHHGMGIKPDEDNPLAFRIVELLLHSNPNVQSYMDYGIEFLDQTVKDEEVDNYGRPV